MGHYTKYVDSSKTQGQIIFYRGNKVYYHNFDEEVCIHYVTTTASELGFWSQSYEFSISCIMFSDFSSSWETVQFRLASHLEVQALLPGRRKTANDNTTNIVVQTNIANVIHPQYYNIPVMYVQDNKTYANTLTNTNITESYHWSTKYNWISYGFISGHLINFINTYHLPFKIIYCADPNLAGREQFAHHTCRCRRQPYTILKIDQNRTSEKIFEWMLWIDKSLQQKQSSENHCHRKQYHLRHG